MALFDDIVGGFLGQQKVPEYRPTNTSDIISQVTGGAPAVGAANLAYNQALAPGMARLNRQVEDIYDPLQGSLRETTTKSILDQLNLGGQLPQDVQDAVIRTGLQKGQAGGIGRSGLGRNLVGRDLGLTSLDLLNQRINRAADYTRSAPGPNQLYKMQDIGFTPGDIASIEIANQNAKNEADIYRSNIEARNARNMWEAPLSLAGKVVSIAAAAKTGGLMGGGEAATPITYAQQPSYRMPNAGLSLASR